MVTLAAQACFLRLGRKQAEHHGREGIQGVSLDTLPQRGPPLSEFGEGAWARLFRVLR